MRPEPDTLKRAQKHAAARLEEVQPKIRAYVPGILKRMGLTYGLPFAGVLIISLLLPRLLLNFIPDSTAAIITWGANLLMLVYGIRATEKRFRGTLLFTLYTQVSKQRRNLEKTLKESQDPDLIMAAAHDLQQAAQLLLEASAESGVTPSGA